MTPCFMSQRIAETIEGPFAYLLVPLQMVSGVMTKRIVTTEEGFTQSGCA
jgi:hypothetical protein